MFATFFFDFVAGMMRKACRRLLYDIAMKAAAALLDRTDDGQAADGWRQQANLRILLVSLRLRDGINA